MNINLSHFAIASNFILIFISYPSPKRSQEDIFWQRKRLFLVFVMLKKYFGFWDGLCGFQLKCDIFGYIFLFNLIKFSPFSDQQKYYWLKAKLNNNSGLGIESILFSFIKKRIDHSQDALELWPIFKGIKLKISL